MNCCLQVYRFLFRCSRRLYKILYDKDTQPVKEIVSPNKHPWIWIGSETRFATHSVTDIVNNHIQVGDRLTNELICEITGINSVQKWSYIDAQTFRMHDFPSEGLLIE
jgi:hypothetical protein